MARITPDIGVPKPSTDPIARIKVTKQEIEKYLKRRKIPVTDRSKSRAKKFLKRRKYITSLPKSKDITVSQSDAPWTTVYGTCRLGGYLTFLHQGGNKKEYLYHVITLAAHEITSVEKLYIDGNLVTFPSHGTDYRVWANGGTKPDGSAINYTNLAFLGVQLGVDIQNAQPDLVGALPTFWTAEHKQSHCAHVVFIAKYNAEIYTGDLPETIFELKGRKFYDPRAGIFHFTDNAALAIADFLTNDRYGCGYSWSQIDTDSLSSAADICDQAVTLAGGGTEPRYTTNGYFTSEQDRGDILADLESAMAGYVTFTNGKWKFWPGVYRTPTVTLTEDDLRSEPEIEILAQESDIFNSVSGQYVSKENGYEATDFPALSVSAYVTEDNGKKIWGEVNLPFTTSSSMAQRIARFRLESSRRQIRFSASWSLKALQLEAGDTVMITLSRYGFSSAVFEVEDWKLLIDQEQAVTVSMLLKQTDSGIDDWVPGTDEQAINISPITTLPDPNVVDAPSGLSVASGTTHLYRRLDGTVFSRLYISWTQSNEEYVIQSGYVEIQYKKSSDSTWQSVSRLTGDATFNYILDVHDGVAYDVRIRFINALSVASNWTTVSNHTVIGKSEPPSNVSAFAATITDTGILFTFSQISDVDRYGYEIRRGDSFAAGTVVGKPRADGPASFLYNSLQAGSFTFWIKAIDTTGNYSAAATSLSLTINAPNPVNNFTASAVANNVLLNWDSPNSSTLTVNKYLVYKADYGVAFASAELLGIAFGTFHTYVERFGGTFSYWVVSEDVGGNRSTEVMSFTKVVPSTDFIIQDDLLLYPELSDTHYALEDDSIEAIYAPVYSEQRAVASMPLILNSILSNVSWSEHFVENGATSIQDFIDGGYVYYLEPTPDGIEAFFEFAVDYGVILPATFIDFRYNTETLNGSVTITPYLKVSEDDVTYTTYDDVQQLFALNVRYITYGVKVVGDDDNSLAKFTSFRAVLQAQRAEETQLITADASDVSGTLVTFDKEFLDVEDIQVSVNTGDDARAIYNYDYGAHPAEQTCLVLVFDANGDRVTEQVSVRIRGVVNS